MKAHAIGTSGKCMKCGDPVTRDLVVLCDACLAKTLLYNNVIEIFWVVTNAKSVILVTPPTAGARWN